MAAAKSHRKKRRRHLHGTESEYRHGCRCERCRTAASAGRRARAQRTAAAHERAELTARIDAVKTLEPTAGKRSEIDTASWSQYIAARKALDTAEREVLRLEAAIKEHMADAERLFIGRRLVATWKTMDYKRVVIPARTGRRFVVHELSKFRPFKAAA